MFLLVLAMIVGCDDVTIERFTEEAPRTFCDYAVSCGAEEYSDEEYSDCTERYEEWTAKYYPSSCEGRWSQELAAACLAEYSSDACDADLAPCDELATLCSE